MVPVLLWALWYRTMSRLYVSKLKRSEQIITTGIRNIDRNPTYTYIYIHMHIVTKHCNSNSSNSHPDFLAIHASASGIMQHFKKFLEPPKDTTITSCRTGPSTQACHGYTMAVHGYFGVCTGAPSSVPVLYVPACDSY